MKFTKAPITLLLCALLLQVSYSTTLEAESKTQAEGGCYLNNNYGRGAGTPLNSCQPGYEQNGALCYPLCRDGFSGNGPVCWQNCPAGFANTGADCLKPGSYGRGTGYVLWHEGKCNNENPQGCEKWGALWYPRCAPNFHNAACCICSPNCPGGMPDIGVSCQKQSYGRGAGVPMGCGANQDKSGALCYPKCKPGWVGIGPVCWTQCPPQYPTKCGALCLSSDNSCAATIVDMIFTGLEAVLETAAEIEDPPAAVMEAVKGGADLAEKLTYGGCY